jgi:hypothetical protein
MADLNFDVVRAKVAQVRTDHQPYPLTDGSRRCSGCEYCPYQDCESLELVEIIDKLLLYIGEDRK